MGTLEIIVIVFVCLFVALSIYSIFFSKKIKALKDKIKEHKKNSKAEKTKKKQEKHDKKVFSDKEKKIEPVIPKANKQEENKEQIAPVVTEPEKKKPEPFRIIRKKSEIKINKKAIKDGSRNPSVTKVFENGKRVDSDQVVKTEQKDSIATQQKTSEIDHSLTYEITREDVGDFGFREPKYLEEDLKSGFNKSVSIGMPNRAPIIGDRTNFTERLFVSSDNNLSGVSGPGIAKAIERADNQTDKMEQKTVDLIEEVRKKLLGDKSKLNFNVGFGGQNYGEMQHEPVSNVQSKLKKIDAKTLIIADAISNPKYKK